ncbi:hypothetical protein HYT23_01705 [Candidatus Pacearchaeota archaeon]|nr:hypothetical protein [Candidatus Pacearchaeota archaeon]
MKVLEYLLPRIHEKGTVIYDGKGNEYVVRSYNQRSRSFILEQIPQPVYNGKTKTIKLEDFLNLDVGSGFGNVPQIQIIDA